MVIDPFFICTKYIRNLFRSVIPLAYFTPSFPSIKKITQLDPKLQPSSHREGHVKISVKYLPTRRGARKHWPHQFHQIVHQKASHHLNLCLNPMSECRNPRKYLFVAYSPPYFDHEYCSAEIKTTTAYGHILYHRGTLISLETMNYSLKTNYQLLQLVNIHFDTQTCTYESGPEIQSIFENFVFEFARVLSML